MSGLRPPPKADRPSRIFARFLTLVLLIAAVGLVIWAAVTNQRLELTETVPHAEVEVAAPALIGDLSINVVHDGLGSQPVILLHDVDIAGGILWDDVVTELGSAVTAVRIDLPGFGLSSRIPGEGADHTVASMAQIVSEIVEQRFRNRAVVFAGVGLGGEVAAEIAVIRPDLVSGLVMIDVDFYKSDGWLEFGEKLPFFGPAVTFAFEGGGPFAASSWAPRCGDGGWCPTASQGAARDEAEKIIGTTDSLRAFRRTPASSLVPSRLDEIVAPTVYIWSSEGAVPRSSVDEVARMIADIEVIEVAVWKAHLDDAAAVADVILDLG